MSLFKAVACARAATVHVTHKTEAICLAGDPVRSLVFETYGSVVIVLQLPHL